MSMIYRVVKDGEVVDDVVALPDGRLMRIPTDMYKTYIPDIDQSHYTVQRGFEHEGQKFYEGDKVQAFVDLEDEVIEGKIAYSYNLGFYFSYPDDDGEYYNTASLDGEVERLKKVEE